MNYDLIRIPMESSISQELYSLLEGEIIERVMREGKVENQKNYLKSILEGTSFKITEKMAPQLHQLCKDVQKKLKFDDPIDFFIQNSPVLNCSAFYRLEDDQNHIVMINSELLERFDEDELRFVVGHEIGHLISKNSNLLRILEFIFPRPEETPLIFHNKISKIFPHNLTLIQNRNTLIHMGKQILDLFSKPWIQSRKLLLQVFLHQ